MEQTLKSKKFNARETHQILKNFIKKPIIDQYDEIFVSNLNKFQNSNLTNTLMRDLKKYFDFALSFTGKHKELEVPPFLLKTFQEVSTSVSYF